ncbi:MAG: phosphotransferase [Gammaproteobacteria bacterium]|nr:phosphotransferase [Gammaproteobacteria bacterium]
MLPLAVTDFTPEFKQEMQIAAGVEVLADLNGFEAHVFRVRRDNRTLILRATHQIHRSSAQLAGELEWMTWLADQGASVCRPVAVRDESYCLELGPFILTMMEEAGGRLISASDWTPEFIQNWGKHLGMLHRSTRGYTPSRPVFKRPEWYEDNNLQFEQLIPENQSDVRAVCEEVLNTLKRMPTTETHYGLVHCDPHPGNFFLDGDIITYFDFDDCCYQWFAYDVATALFSAVGQPWMSKADDAQQAEARRFLPFFLKGYESVSPLPSGLLESLPLFLKLRELTLYALSFAHATESFHGNSFDNGFMKGRREKISRRVPFLLENFTHLY